MYVSPTLAVLPPYKSGRVRLLAVSSAERLAAAPEIPTLVEKGLPFVRFGWLGVCAGSGTPQSVIALLNRQIGAVAHSPEYGRANGEDQPRVRAAAVTDRVQLGLTRLRA